MVAQFSTGILAHFSISIYNKDVFSKRKGPFLKTNLSFLPACKTGNFPTCYRLFPENDQAFSPSSYFFLCRESCLFPCPTRTMIGLETVLRVFGNCLDSFQKLSRQFSRSHNTLLFTG
ncbi:hypothetical protein KTG13_21110, partial [Phocaeicola vulgatus]|uniref:hypothetical protein n=1 Tax=Phocaeicola vulgatus TaxID=821 RepID=UPI001C21DE02